MTTAAFAVPTWEQVLAEQDGVLSRRQAITGGMSEDRWQWRFSSGRWQRVFAGVAVAHTGPLTQRQRAWAALLVADEHAALTGDAALIELGMKLPSPEVIHLATPGRIRTLPKRGAAHLDPPLSVVPHRVVRLNDVVHPARAPRLVRAPAAVLHASAWAVSDRAAEWRTAAAVQQRLVTVTALRDVARVLHHVPRRALVLEVLDDVELGASARSELDLLALLRRSGLPLPDRMQRPVRTGTGRFYLDAWWERWRLAVEVDGAQHMEVRGWDADTLRTNSVLVEHLADRVLLMRFTTGNLRHDGDVVCQQLAAVLR